MLYFGQKSVILKTKLSQHLGEFFPQHNAHLVLVNPFTISSFFKFKDALPKALCSSVIYKFRCAENGTASEYFGLTTRRLADRVAEHRGVSPRTRKLSSKPPLASFRNYSVNSSCDIDLNSVQVVSSDKSVFSLKILESIYIHKNRPNFKNESGSCISLFLVP